MTRNVMKFGGSSLRDADRLRQVARLVSQGPDPSLVVVSAMGKTTDALFRAASRAQSGHLAGALDEIALLRCQHLRAAAAALAPSDLPESLTARLDSVLADVQTLLQGMALLRERTPRSLDALAASGELLSSAILTALLVSMGRETELVDARTVMITSADFGQARPQADLVARHVRGVIVPHLAAGRVVVTQGYIGATEEGLTTTLGRGGSDYSAAVLGAALGAGEVQIWTDVEGILTCDPRLVPEASPIPALSFAEAAELAAFGAKVLHPSTIQPAVEAGIPVTVRHTERPEGSFTTITSDGRSGRPVTALATHGPVTVLTATSAGMLNQPGFLARFFGVFGRLGVSVDLVATAEVSVSLTVEADTDLPLLLAELKPFATVTVHENRSIVAVVGERLRQTPGIAARVFSSLEDINAELITMGANEINLSFIVRAEETPSVLRRLHRALIETDPGGAE